MEHEGRLLMQLRYPRIVQLFGISTSGRDPSLVLEYMAGGSLQDLLTSRTLDHIAYFSIAKDVALALGYLHSKTIVHLDVKSNNVLLDASRLRAKLCDFGFSRRASKTTFEGIVRGTPACMAPEVLLGEAIDPKADVYSFGLLLWEMLCSKRPFDGCTVKEVFQKLNLGERPAMPSDCPEEVRALIESCWDQMPEKRPDMRSVREVLSAIQLPKNWRALANALEIQPTADFIDLVRTSRQNSRSNSRIGSRRESVASISSPRQFIAVPTPPPMPPKLMELPSPPQMVRRPYVKPTCFAFGITEQVILEVFTFSLDITLVLCVFFFF